MAPNYNAFVSFFIVLSFQEKQKRQKILGDHCAIVGLNLNFCRQVICLIQWLLLVDFESIWLF